MPSEIKKLMLSEMYEFGKKILAEMKEDKTLIEIVNKTDYKNSMKIITSDFDAMIKPMISKKPRLQKFYQDNVLECDAIFSNFKQNFLFYAQDQKMYR